MERPRVIRGSHNITGQIRLLSYIGSWTIASEGTTPVSATYTVIPRVNPDARKAGVELRPGLAQRCGTYSVVDRLCSSQKHANRLCSWVVKGRRAVPIDRAGVSRTVAYETGLARRCMISMS